MVSMLGSCTHHWPYRLAPGFASPATAGPQSCGTMGYCRGSQWPQRGFPAPRRCAQFGLLQALSMSVRMYIIQPTLIYITPAPAMAKLSSDTCATRHAHRHRYPPGIKAALVLPGCHTHTRETTVRSVRPKCAVRRRRPPHTSPPRPAPHPKPAHSPLPPAPAGDPPSPLFPND